MTIAHDLQLKDLLKKCSNAFWAGSQPPVAWMKSSERIYDPASDYRLPQDFHQQFEIVYLVERDLGHVKAWPLVVDEALRLLAPGGVLVIRATNTRLLSIFELKNLLAVWGPRALEPYFEHSHDGGTVQFGVKNTLSEPRTAGLAGFSFGVITDGKRPELLREFVASALAVERNHGEQVEVLVCGPSFLKAQLAALSGSVLLIPEPDSFATQGWITRKKNLLVRAAHHENLVIAHDRYTIPADFITRLRQFGCDYSVLVCRQVRPDGRRIPDWVALGSEWIMTTPATLDYGDWSRHAFVNGGIMIAKAEVLKNVGWNELLFWSQAEDVELTRRMRANGHVPRLARNLTVTSQPQRPGFIESFEAYPPMPDRHWVTGPPGVNGEQILPQLNFGRAVLFGKARERRGEHLGVWCDDEWRLEADGIRLRPGVYGEIVFRLVQHPLGLVEIVMGASGPDRDDVEVLVNDITVKGAWERGGSLRFAIPQEAYRFNGITRLHIRTQDTDFAIGSLTVGMPGIGSLTVGMPGIRGALWNGRSMNFSSGSPATAALVRGWAQPEPWGVWTMSDSADIAADIGESGLDVAVEGRATAFFKPGSAGKRIGVLANGVAIGNFHIQAKRRRFFGIVVPRDIARQSRTLILTFVPENPCSPAEIGFSQDYRLLGMGLVELSVCPVRHSWFVPARVAMRRLKFGFAWLARRVLRVGQ